MTKNEILIANLRDKLGILTRQRDKAKTEVSNLRSSVEYWKNRYYNCSNFKRDK